MGIILPLKPFLGVRNRRKKLMKTMKEMSKIIRNDKKWNEETLIVSLCRLSENGPSSHFEAISAGTGWPWRAPMYIHVRIILFSMFLFMCASFIYVLYIYLYVWFVVFFLICYCPKSDLCKMNALEFAPRPSPSCRSYGVIPGGCHGVAPHL